MEQEWKIQLQGLCCSNCAGKIEVELGKKEGYKTPSINLMKQELTVISLKENSVVLQEVEDVVHRHEPEVKVFFANDIKKESTDGGESRNKGMLRFGVGLSLFVLALFQEGKVEFVLFFLSYLIFGYDVLLRAMKNIGKGQVFDENFLMSVSTIGAFFLGQWAEGVFVMLFYQVGEAFQEYAVNRSRKSISSVLELRPEIAHLVREGEIIDVKPDTVSIGDIVLVKPGERIPLDGIVREGEGELDTAALTGESMPCFVEKGEVVQSGSINQNGLLKVEVTTPFGESTAEKIIALVEEATEKKSKTEQFITKFARVYTPFVVAFAVLLAVLPPVLGFGAFSLWVSRSLVFLVVSCPCALVLSVPLGFFSGIGASSKIGVLVKGSQYFQGLSQIDTIIFDKTGTLTKGVFEVIAVVAEEGQSQEEVLFAAVLGERKSNHPMAKGVVSFGKEIPEIEVSHFSERAGYGISYQYEGELYFVGNQRLMAGQGIVVSMEEGNSVMYVAKGNKLLGKILLADVLKEDAKETIEKLRKLGVRSVYMLTGDKKEVAKTISDTLGLDGFFAELLPQDKVSAVEEVYAKKPESKVLFVGDGINDAPVLGRVDIGVAMGSGADIAIETADVVVMNSQLERIGQSISIARNTKRIVKQNIIFALGIKAIVLCLAAVGMATMWMAVFADVGVSVLAILNAMRPKMKE